MTPQPPASAPVYRPLSGLAVAGFGLAFLVAGAVVVLGAVAWYNRLPMAQGWLLAAAAVAAGLSLAGWIHVGRSEGTRAGLGLARWGLYLSGLVGLGYAAYLAATELAIRQQARDFTQTWLANIAGGELPAAFYDSLSPAMRRGGNPRDPAWLLGRHLQNASGSKGAWPLFLEQPVVRLLQQAGADGRVESLGVEGWQLHEGGFLVEQRYRLTTPEGEFEFSLPVWGSDGQAADGTAAGRQWCVYWRQPLVLSAQPRLTEFGRAMDALRKSCARHVLTWARQVQDVPAGLVRSDRLKTGDESATQAIRRAVPGLLRPNQPEPVTLELPEVPGGDLAFWQLEGGRLIMRQPILIRIGSKYVVEGTVVVEADDPGLVEQLTTLLAAGRAGEPQGAPPTAVVEPRWRIRQLDLEFGFQPAPAR